MVFLAGVVGTWCIKFLGAYTNIYMDIYAKGIVLIIKDRLHAMSYVTWACQLYPVAVGHVVCSAGSYI